MINEAFITSQLDYCNTLYMCRLSLLNSICHGFLPIPLNLADHALSFLNKTVLAGGTPKANILDGLDPVDPSENN